jgi:hypothetical protein
MEADKRRKTARFGIAEGRAIKETEGTIQNHGNTPGHVLICGLAAVAIGLPPGSSKPRR